MLRKLGLIFLGLVISSLLPAQVGSTILSEKMTNCYPSEFLEKEKKLYRAWIGIEYEDSYLKIRAFCFNNTLKDEVLRYKLEAKKSGKSGTAHSCQSGSVYIPSQEKKCLSQLTLGVSPKDHYQITLEVYKDEKLVAEDSVFYPWILEVHRPPGITCLSSLVKAAWSCETKRSFAFSAPM